jgi:hypothetical protein
MANLNKFILIIYTDRKRYKCHHRFAFSAFVVRYLLGRSGVVPVWAKVGRGV